MDEALADLEKSPPPNDSKALSPSSVNGTPALTTGPLAGGGALDTLIEYAAQLQDATDRGTTSPSTVHQPAAHLPRPGAWFGDAQPEGLPGGPSPV
ncbi:hypothetical protein ACFXOY_11145 [Streptomyces niveus]|uniref:hypothetical protein n=1 Tax=Streptomyces niveus TaxID=193462 RepID=UPI0036B8A951